LPDLPPIADQPLSVVLLAHNDEPHLEAVLDAWAAQLEGPGRPYELLLVDDGSSDGTAAQVEARCARLPALRYIRLPQPSGFGAALRAGLAQAQFPLVFYTTADRQYQPGDLPAFLAEIDKVHFVSGFRRWQPVPWLGRIVGTAYRALAKILFDVSTPPLPGWLGWREHCYRLLIRIVFAVRSRDVNCCYVLCRREVFGRLPIQSDSCFAQTEVLAKVNFLGYLIGEEIPIAYRPRPGGDRRSEWFADFWRVLNDPDFSPVALAPLKAAQDKNAAPVSG
jgi:glycosyltransferase involved in cell wall biosynthesis